MPRWIAALLLAACLCAPDCAIARSDQGQFRTTLAAADPAGDSMGDGILGIPKEQAMVVGAGIVAGAVVLHLLVPGDFTYFAGGVVGGLAALWWYENHGETRLRPNLKLDRAAAVMDARSGLLLEGPARGR